MTSYGGSDRYLAAEAARGPRWIVSGHIRAGEIMWTYYTTADKAQDAEARLRTQGYHQVMLVEPEQYEEISIQVRDLGKQLAAARKALADLTEQATAITPQANDGGSGIAETRLAAELGVDRMTIRKWLGKR